METPHAAAGLHGLLRHGLPPLGLLIMTGALIWMWTPAEHQLPRTFWPHPNIDILPRCNMLFRSGQVANLDVKTAQPRPHFIMTDMQLERHNNAFGYEPERQTPERAPSTKFEPQVAKRESFGDNEDLCSCAQVIELVGPPSCMLYAPRSGRGPQELRQPTNHGALRSLRIF